MAILSMCPICGGNFKDGRSYTATSGVAFAPPHPLYEFCDAGLHLGCLVDWPHRVEFSRGYFDGAKKIAIAYGTLLVERSDWILRCGPAPKEKEPYFAEVDLVDWPFRLYSRYELWDEFTTGTFREGLDGPALVRAEEIMREVVAIAPDLSSLRSLRTQLTAKEVPKKQE